VVRPLLLLRLALPVLRPPFLRLRLQGLLAPLPVFPLVEFLVPLLFPLLFTDLLRVLLLPASFAV
jgi:hypothetical protein